MFKKCLTMAAPGSGGAPRRGGKPRLQLVRAPRQNAGAYTSSIAHGTSHTAPVRPVAQS